MEEITSLTPSYGGISYERIEKVGLQWPCPAPGHPGTPVLHEDRFSRGLGFFSPVEYQPPAELPDTEYPFLLSTGRCYFHFHGASMTKRSRLLQREVPLPYIEISPEDAKELGLMDREWVWVTTRRGEVKAQARVTDVVRKGVLFMPFHFEEGSANALTHNALDPECKIPEYKVCAARIRRAR
jgi:formate dehydrogenase major subunit/formate dehydrogenase alpha subunit